MGYYKLIRQPAQGKAVKGTLCAVKHSFSGSVGHYNQSLTPIAATLENADYLIPALNYKITVTHSPKFKRLLPQLTPVPQRTGIRFHRGNKPEHSKGCILVSAADEQKLTALWLNEQIQNGETRLEIC